jgi:hypothetical protein
MNENKAKEDKKDLEKEQKTEHPSSNKDLWMPPRRLFLARTLTLLERG